MQNNSLPISFDLRSVRRKYGLTVLCLHDKMQISKPTLIKIEKPDRYRLTVMRIMRKGVQHFSRRKRRS